LVVSFLVLACFYLFGSLILQLFGITIPVVQVSGGIVLSVMGWQMLNGSSEDKSATDGGLHDTGTSIVAKAFYPYTFPITVGPGGLAVAMTFGAHVQRGTSMGLAERVGGVVGIFAMASGVFAQEVGSLRGKPSKEQILQALSPVLRTASEPEFRDATAWLISAGYPAATIPKEP